MSIQYVAHQTDRFKKSLSKLDKPIRNRVERAILQEITVNPYGSDLLVSPLKGKRDYRLGDYRIVFAICAECREKSYQQFNGCVKCSRYGRNDLILFDVGHRNRIYTDLTRLQRLKLG